MKQQTIKKEISLSGLALHSGKEASVRLLPAAADAGIVFVVRGQKIPALAENVTDTTRGTSLGRAQVVEHLLAAAYGLGIDNLIIELEGGEPPALDGSAYLFMEAIKRAGLAELPEEKLFWAPEKEILLEDSGASLQLIPYNGFAVHFVIEFPVIGRQELSYDGDFSSIAQARTFGFLDELEGLRKKGLALGVTDENSLAIGDRGYANTLRYPDEPVRHKVLDLLGDLALVGHPINGKIEAFKSGHRLNVALARRIREACLTSRTS
jgi:UDP-3-O-[3-hydroxymyristoyl] N-acetylglucosamine deacetylase